MPTNIEGRELTMAVLEMSRRPASASVACFPAQRFAQKVGDHGIDERDIGSLEVDRITRHPGLVGRGPSGDKPSMFGSSSCRAQPGG